MSRKVVLGAEELGLTCVASDRYVIGSTNGPLTRAVVVLRDPWFKQAVRVSVPLGTTGYTPKGVRRICRKFVAEGRVPQPIVSGVRVATVVWENSGLVA